MDISYRKANNTDIPSMVELLYQLFSIEADFTFDRDLHTEGLSLLLQSGDCTVLVAEYNSSVIGMGTMQKRISTASGSCWGLIEDIVIDSSYRGKGIGSQLLKELEDHARKAGLRGITLAADKNNSPAINFYSSQNWEKTDLIYLRKTL